METNCLSLNQQLASFLYNSACSELVVENLIKMAKDNSYLVSDQNLKDVTFTKESKVAINYYQNLVIGVSIGEVINDFKFKVIASHNDCPLLKVKINGFYQKDNKVLASCDFYGGVLGYPWFDRPLRLVGKVVYKLEDKIKEKAFDSIETMGILPSLAIHYNRNVNDGFKVDRGNDLKVLCDSRLLDIKEYLSKQIDINKDDILSYELYFANNVEPTIMNQGEYIASSHLDNAQCAYTTFRGFFDEKQHEGINVCVSFDGEEIGSDVLSGALSKHLDNLLRKISHDLGYSDDQYHLALNQSLMISVDNAHASHYTHENLFDNLSGCDMNKGIVIKYSPRKSYQSDAYSSAILKMIMDKHNIDYQEFENKAGVLGGGTLGGLSLKQCSMPTVDIGLAQYAMHSCYELAGCQDSMSMYQLAYYFFSEPLQY